jgi:phage terminase large subunit-like protein
MACLPPPGAESPVDFLSRLVWIDGRPLLSTVEPYRLKILTDVLWSFDDDGRPLYNMGLCGRGKKNFKTSDLCLAALYRFLSWPSTDNTCLILANDEAQAGDDLSLCKKLIAANPILAAEVEVHKKEISRIDGNGSLMVLPAGDIAGAHGKTYLFCGFDEIHSYKSHDLFEALAPDPTRKDVLVWITSYAGIRHAPGIPLYDFLQSAKAGEDERMYFSWYAGDFTTDAALVDAETPEERANPSLATFMPGYLKQQKKRLPSHKYRRLHLNLPGAPDGAFLDGDSVMNAIVPGRKALSYEAQWQYVAGVDMSSGSTDDAVLAMLYGLRAR